MAIVATNIVHHSLVFAIGLSDCYVPVGVLVSAADRHVAPNCSDHELVNTDGVGTSKIVDLALAVPDSHVSNTWTAAS